MTESYLIMLNSNTYFSKRNIYILSEFGHRADLLIKLCVRFEKLKILMNKTNR